MIALAALLFSFLHAQDVPPPPKPKDDGPSLEVTMKYIQDGLNSLQQEWKPIPGNGIIRKSTKYRVFDAAADRAACMLSLRAAEESEVEAYLPTYYDAIVNLGSAKYSQMWRFPNHRVGP